MAITALVLMLAAACQAQRMEIPFSYNWRYSFVSAWADPENGLPGPYGAHPSTQFQSGYWEIVPSGYLCSGPFVEQNPNRFNWSDCGTACAYDPTCLAWQASSKMRHCSHSLGEATCAPSKDGYDFGGKRTAKQASQPLYTDYEYAQPSFDDSSWSVVSAPHDAIFWHANITSGADTHHGFFDRNGTAWYRKTFTVPSSATTWAKSLVYVRFEGVFHHALVWVDGKVVAARGFHEGGYSEFTVRLDNATALAPGSKHVLVVRADPSFGSGHWYEGGGIYRPVTLVVVPKTSIVENGLYVSPEVDTKASDVKIPVSAEVQSVDGSGSTSATLSFSITPSGGGAAIATASTTVSIPSDGSTVIGTVTLDPPSGSIQPWTVHGALALYEVSVSMTVSGASSASDSQTTVTGFRTAEATVNDKYHLNGESFELRGFSHHNSFAVVGVGMPPRVDLFRAQQSKGVGSNFWRMSHNPYRRSTYEILDRIGMTVWDEHRDYGEQYVPGVYDMVKRTRNRPSIIMWSYCNEYECGCGTNATGDLFRKACKSLDPDRATAANGNPNGNGIDIQGHSHSKNNTFITFHEQNPNVPQILSECCSCTSQRLPVSDRTLPSCIADQNSPGLLPYVLGSSGVWTLFDYAGESHTWPNVWCSFGQFSFAGFPKPHAYWYRTNWLAKRAMSDPGRVNQPEIHDSRILELADQLGAGGEVRAVTDSPFAELYLDGRRVGRMATAGTYPDQTQMVAFSVSSNYSQCVFPTNVSGVQCHGLESDDTAKNPTECAKACCAEDGCAMWQFDLRPGGHGCWIGSGTDCTPPPDGADWVGGSRQGVVPFRSNMTVKGISADGKVESSHTLQRVETPSQVGLYVDVPSPTSGTGSAVVLDGTDVALIRAAIEDRRGNLVSTLTANVSFSVVSGPGRIIGSGSGDPACHCPPTGSECSTYGGLVRAVVQVTYDCMSENRGVLAELDRDEGRYTTVAGDGTSKTCPTGEPIVVAATATLVNATAPGIAATTFHGTISIKTSTDPADTPLAVAEASGRKAAQEDLGAWMTAFQG